VLWCGSVCGDIGVGVGIGHNVVDADAYPSITRSWAKGSHC